MPTPSFRGKQAYKSYILRLPHHGYTRAKQLQHLQLQNSKAEDLIILGSHRITLDLHCKGPSRGHSDESDPDVTDSSTSGVRKREAELVQMEKDFPIPTRPPI
ncbi:hypothetical protein Asppvi_010989 [Aspergillus pseudoviridinutans]|uniref:Uncharacterized protein n=1 Tax=Aspergillus pseudoviridinutans TaxID=1517512 RepID=A0A9P3BKD0_9EURO|nr:uncharacterized protein Asppvi_010989 [Aspergillus pseudoviridinutans]GIJ92014.1 hypothetical protein Asppvi_010989 [Aspergillus pseudoviridinutans]